jgi:hypothetical protein
MYNFNLLNTITRLFDYFLVPVKFYVATTPDLGNGATITFSSGFLALITDISISGIEREAIDSSTLSTSGGKTFMPSDVYDAGELSVEMQFATDGTPPITSAAETVTVTFPDAETLIAQGFMTGFEISDITNESIMKASATIKFTGSITF